MVQAIETQMNRKLLRIQVRSDLKFTARKLQQAQIKL